MKTQVVDRLQALLLIDLNPQVPSRLIHFQRVKSMPAFLFRSVSLQPKTCLQMAVHSCDRLRLLVNGC